MKEPARELFAAAGADRLDGIQAAIERGADINARDRGRKTPLHYAATLGHANAVWMLIDRGADVNALDRWGTTPLHWAAQNGHTDTAKLLIDKGADIKAEDMADRTPRDYAIAGKAPYMIALLEDAARNAPGHADRITNRRDADGTRQR